MTRISALAATVVVLSGALLAPPSIQTARAQKAPSADEIVRKLQPAPERPRTRSLRRGITVHKGKRKRGKPSVNLYVNFAFNSDRLGTDAQLTLDSLGRALSDPRLKGYRFLIAGHTDAVGTDAYNMDLSQRRAAAVRNYLISRFRIDAARLRAVGYGETRLLDPNNPKSGVNRRVQVVNEGGDS